MAIETVVGKQATIHFDAEKCIHSRGCVLSHPDVFVPNVKGEWIYPDAQPMEELMHLAKACPSGAIRVMRNPAVAGLPPDSDAAPMVNTVRVRENGPLAFEAELLIGGQKQASPRATLCRCGQSNNKPFCDGSHTVAEFTASGEPITASFETLAVRNGPLDVRPVAQRPLARGRQPGSGKRHRAHLQQSIRDIFVPLRTIEEQTVLRRIAQGCGICRSMKHG